MAQFDKLATRLAAVWGRGEISAAAHTIEVGKIAHAAVRCRLRDAPEKSTRVLRAEAIDSLATTLRRAGHRVQPVELNRAIRVYHVAQLFGPDVARKLPLRTLVALSGLIRRNGIKEEWGIRKKVDAAGEQLFARAAKMTAEQVKVEVDGILGRKSPAAKPPVSALEKTIKLVAALPPVEQRQLYQVLHKRFATPTMPMPKAA